ncbi:hypothetical protein EWH99_02020 [Sporolactobacillus sp. THM7-7]|nr:hypothetical protein EWH99_02020 [Sporolactobacillus sp. THM7-7]
MIFWLIIADEIAFWLFISMGLVTRYIFIKKRLSFFLLACTPVLDFILLIFTFFDLKNGNPATFAHTLSAVYIGISIAFGSKMIQWADAQFAYRFAGGSKPEKEMIYGREKALRERHGWYRHLVAWVIGAGLMLAIHLFAGHPEETQSFLTWILRWAIILVIDFFISFSYTVFPKKAPQRNN